MKNIAKMTAAVILLTAILSTFAVSADSETPFKSLEDELMKLFNEARTEAGMAVLEQSETLTGLARLKAEEMAEKKSDEPDFPDGMKAFLKENGAEAAAQNYYSAAGQKKADDVMAIWKRHVNFDRDTWAKEKFTHIGVGAAKGSDGKMYYVCILTKPFDSSDWTAIEDEVIRLINEERAKHGLKALTKNADLMKTARMKAQDMADNNYCAHRSPTYGTPSQMVKKYAKGVSYGGENIASGQKTASEVFTAWKNSDGHRAIMLKKNINCAGIGVAVDSKGIFVWSLIVGTK